MTKTKSKAVRFSIGMGMMYLIVLFIVHLLLLRTGNTFTDLPYIIERTLKSNPLFGPLILVIVYAVSAIVPVPTASLAAIGGALYGTFEGAILALVGLWVSSTIGFYLSRKIGAKAVKESEEAWIQHANILLTQKGFYPVLLSRLLHVPFDAVSVGAGLSGMRFRTFSLATVIGSIPSAVLFAEFGDSLNDPGVRLMAGGGIVVLLVLIYALRKQPFIKRLLIDL